MKPVLERVLSTEGDTQPSDVLSPASRDERRPVELSGYLIRSNKKIVDIKVVDLSYDGCAIRTLVKLVPGEKVKLSVLGRGAVNAVVRWYKSRKAGLLFQPERVSRTHWPRKAERIEVRAEASLRRAGRLSYRVATFDVTRFGCKCEFVERPAMYERVWIKFQGLETVHATVCWIEESSLGLMYNSPLHPAVFDMLLSRLNPCSNAPLATSDQS
ncbi:MAG: hypothetical protein ABI454_06285 [Sphingomicrobium sp.]